MKKLDTLKKTLATLEEEKLNALLKEIAKNESTDMFESFAKRDALALLQFAELEKALKVKDKYELVLDINYSEYRSTDIKLTQMSLLNNKQKRALHLYQHNDTFDICFSTSKVTKEKLIAIKEYIQSLYKLNLVNSVLQHIHFDELVTACKFALIILESSLEELIAYTEKQSKTE